MGANPYCGVAQFSTMGLEGAQEASFPNFQILEGFFADFSIKVWTCLGIFGK